MVPSSGMGDAYQFTTEWRVAGTVEEVKAILGDDDSTSVVRWWPSVYLGVEQLDAGGDGGLGRVVAVHTKGWLPYTLRWTLRVTEALTDAGYALAASGDLEGTGRWRFEQDGPEVVIVYHWRIRATKPLLRRLEWLLRPAFSANHHWAMKQGQESLRLELRRRRIDDSAPPVPPPPPPTFRWLVRK